MTSLDFNEYAELTDGEIVLVLKEKQPAPPKEGYLPQYHFDICLVVDNEQVGKIRLRVGYSELVKYSGNIGYEIKEEYRGHRYAAKACMLIKKVAQYHSMKTCWITCRPDNVASIRTCEYIKAKFVEIIEIPKDFEMYMQGNKQMCRFRWDVGPY